MDNDISSPHDVFFKNMMGRVEIARTYVQHYLPAETTSRMDLSTLEMDTEGYVDDRLKTHFSDVVALQELDAGRARTGGEDQAERIAHYLDMPYLFFIPMFISRMKNTAMRSSRTCRCASSRPGHCLDICRVASGNRVARSGLRSICMALR